MEKMQQHTRTVSEQEQLEQIHERLAICQEALHSRMSESETSSYCLYPVENHALFRWYEKQRDMFWVPQEVDLSSDRGLWDTLSIQEQQFIAFVLCFFAEADGMVTENITSNFQEEVGIKEARAFYNMQNAIETVHNEMYSLMIDTVIRDVQERSRMRNAIRNVPSITAMAAWITYWMEPRYSLCTRLLAQAVYEGVFFSCSFCAIRWLQRLNKMPGFCQANELIARDEKLHFKFAIRLLKELHIQDDVTVEQFRLLLLSSFRVLSAWIKQALQVELIGMDSEGMIQYAQCCYNYLCRKLGYEQLFPEAVNPYDWMKELAMPNKTNFFERKVTEYSKTRTDTYSFELKQEY